MNQLPETKDALVLRSDFSDEIAWESICAAIREPAGQFRAYVDCISDPQYESVTPEQVPPLITQASNHTFIFIVDRVAMTQPDHPILVIDLYTQPGRTFRVIPSEMASVENNLSIANMDFEEFAESVDEDGVFRGFSEGDQHE